jgi:adhesin transport system membrane fusion protein
MKKEGYNQLSNDELEFVDDKTAALLLNTPHSTRIILWVICAFFIIAIIWASFAVVDKVTVGQGKVIPSSQIQVVQNLEGGLVKKILIKEGDHVVKGQQLLLIDDTRFLSDFREREQEVSILKANVIQLSASIDSVRINNDFNEKNWQDSVVIHSDKLTFPQDLIDKNHN